MTRNPPSFTPTPLQQRLWSKFYSEKDMLKKQKEVKKAQEKEKKQKKQEQRRQQMQQRQQRQQHHMHQQQQPQPKPQNIFVVVNVGTPEGMDAAQHVIPQSRPGPTQQQMFQPVQKPQKQQQQVQNYAQNYDSMECSTDSEKQSVLEERKTMANSEPDIEVLNPNSFRPQAPNVNMSQSFVCDPKFFSFSNVSKEQRLRLTSDQKLLIVIFRICF